MPTEADLVRVMLDARIRYYQTITYTLLCIVAVCVLTLAGTFYLPSHPEKEVTTLFISLTSGLFGSLVTILTQSIQAARKLQSDEDIQTEIYKVKSTELKPPPIETPPPI